jgi:tetratricopeptide (TPR) repeat protein
VKSWTRNTLLGAAVVALAAGLVVVGAAVGAPRGAVDAPASSPAAARAGSIEALQAQLKRSPGDAEGWAALGLAYVQQARLSADPTYYPKAQGAFGRSLEVQPEANAPALTGQATLAAARHDFAGALKTVQRSLAVNDYDATAYGVKADALTELGRYDEAAQAAQRMLDLRPGLDAYARASYQRELRGDVAGARTAMQQAVERATSPADEAFGRYYLGELAWNNGDLGRARSEYDAVAAVDPTYLPATVGQAKVLAAGGDTTAALGLYRQAVETQPQPQYVVELGELLEASGQAAEARTQYEVVRATQQLFAASGADVDLELALFEGDHGTPAKALQYASAAYRTRPDSVLVQDAYAWALHKAGRSAEALPIARKAQRLGTRLPYLRYHLGVVEAAVGDRVAARRSLTGALALNPSFNPLQAPAARALLKTLG